MIMVLKSPGFPVLFVGRVILVSILTCRCNFISCFGLLLLWLLFSCKKKGGGRRDRSGGVVRESDRRCALRTPPNPSIPPFTSLSKGIPCLYCKVWVTMVVAKACLDLPDILNPINSLPFSLYIKPWFYLSLQSILSILLLLFTTQDTSFPDSLGCQQDNWMLGKRYRHFGQHHWPGILRVSGGPFLTTWVEIHPLLVNTTVDQMTWRRVVPCCTCPNREDEGYDSWVYLFVSSWAPRPWPYRYANFPKHERHHHYRPNFLQVSVYHWHVPSLAQRWNQSGWGR